MNQLHLWLFFVLIVLLYSGCAASSTSFNGRNTKPKVSSSYTSSFPPRDVSDKIESIFSSVKRISSSSTYSTYYFDGQLLTFDQIRKGDLKELATRELTKNESVAGTAISIAGYRQNTALLTCAHVVNFPDTLIEYIKREDLPLDTYVNSIAIKLFQRNFLYDLPNVAEFDIMDLDERDDLALIVLSGNSDARINVPPLSIQWGDSKKLTWGSFVYIAGYPKGFPMVVRGIVSDPNRSDEGDFLTDALFNPGISGGIVLASRNNFSSFEWVGMANAASATNSMVLVPDPSKSGYYKTLDPYPGTAFIEKRSELSYGITQAIPTGKIISFLKRNRRMLRYLGLNVDRL